MQLNHKSLALLLVVVAGLVAGAYGLGRKQTLDVAAAPASHPPHAQATTQAAASAEPDGPPEGRLEGKVQVDPMQAFTHFRVGNKNVKSIFQEGKTLWVGTSGGLVRYNTGTDEFKVFDVRNGLLSNGTFYVGKLQGKIAVGTYGGGLSLLNEKTQEWETYNVPEGLGDAFVYDVLETSSGDVWIATWSGANRIRGGRLKDRSKWELYTVENTRGGVPNDWVYGLAEGKNGDVWLATEGGLARYRGGKWENWNHQKGLGAPFETVKKDIAFKSDPSQVSSHHARQKEEMGLQNVDIAYNPNYIIALEVDRNGVVWAGTWGGGLARFDGQKWTNYTTAEGLPGNHVFMLHIDARQQLWVGTNNGLALMKDDRFQVMTVNDGLFTNNVFAMSAPSDGTLWVGGYGGVAHLRKPLFR